MRTVLVELPAKALFVLALLLAVIAFVRDYVRTRRVSGAKLTSTFAYLLAGAWALMWLRGGAFVPTADTFSHEWQPVPIYAYGVMLILALMIGWFLAMRLAQQDGIDAEAAGAIYVWTAVWAVVGARVLYVIVNFKTFSSPTEALMIHRG